MGRFESKPRGEPPAQRGSRARWWLKVAAPGETNSHKLLTSRDPVGRFFDQSIRFRWVDRNLQMYTHHQKQEPNLHLEHDYTSNKNWIQVKDAMRWCHPATSRLSPEQVQRGTEAVDKGRPLGGTRRCTSGGSEPKASRQTRGIWALQLSESQSKPIGIKTVQIQPSLTPVSCLWLRSLENQATMISPQKRNWKR